MEVIPAIDLREGRCVRLFQGDFAQETVYGEDPVAVARHWEELGAPRIHVVDLDGAAAGAPVQAALVADIVRSVRIPVQVGGGIRDVASAAAYRRAGLDRMVVGTAAAEETELLRSLLHEFGDAIAVAIDAREGRVAVRGWRETTCVSVEDFIATLESEGVRRVIYTDILRDGTLTRPNFATIEALVRRGTLRVIASGGVTSVDDVRQLRDMGADGVIIGRALYTGDLDLPAALQAAA